MTITSGRKVFSLPINVSKKFISIIYNIYNNKYNQYKTLYLKTLIIL